MEKNSVPSATETLNKLPHSTLKSNRSKTGGYQIKHPLPVKELLDIWSPHKHDNSMKTYTSNLTGDSVRCRGHSRRVQCINPTKSLTLTRFGDFAEPNRVPASDPQIKMTSEKYDWAKQAARNRGRGCGDRWGNSRERERGFCSEQNKRWQMGRCTNNSLREKWCSCLVMSDRREKQREREEFMRWTLRFSWTRFLSVAAKWRRLQKCTMVLRLDSKKKLLCKIRIKTEDNVLISVTSVWLVFSSLKGWKTRGFSLEPFCTDVQQSH